MKKVIFRPEAETEVLEAQIWYEEQVLGLGLEFARAVDAAVSSIKVMWSKIVGFSPQKWLNFRLPNERVISAAEEQLMSM